MTNAEHAMKIKEWIINRERIGKSCFSREDVIVAFPSLMPRSINTSLAHFAKVRLIERLHRGFYCVVPPQYALSECIHPYYYIDDLMSWLNRPYYLSLLSATSLWGASHQKVMATQVMTQLPQLNVSSNRNSAIDWFYRKTVPSEFVLAKNGENGKLFYSNAELTAVDLVRYVDRAGGFSFVATVLAELKEETDFSNAANGVFRTACTADIQRLGYVYEEVLGDHAQAAAIYDQLRTMTKQLDPIMLSPSSREEVKSKNGRWKVLVNSSIEIDDV